MQWPKARSSHSSAVVRSVYGEDMIEKHYLIVLGGRDDCNNETADCWVFDIDDKTWQQVYIITHYMKYTCIVYDKA